MTTILPAERTPWDVIGKTIGANLSQNLPGAVQQGYQRQMGFNALDQAKNEIAQAGNDPMKIAMAMSRLAIASPESSRALGPIAQTAMQNAQLNRAFPNEPGQFNQPVQQPQQQMAPMMAQNAIAQGSGQELPIQSQNVTASPNLLPSQNDFIPGPFNIKTVDEIDTEAKRYARAINDPNAYNTRFSQLQAQNNAATAQREALEDYALKAGVEPKDLPLFMKVGAKFDPRNPNEWAVKANRAWKEAKSNFDKLERAFIPGIGNALLGENREENLKNLEGNVQDLIKDGLEQETRTFLADNYLTPTEIEGLVHPLTQQKIKAIDKVPKSVFPLSKVSYEKGFPEVQKSGFIPYEEALEKAPKELEFMKNTLTNFFLNNVDKNTSLLQLRDKLIHDKHYDWRQIGPAIREAEKRGLKLEKFQSTEMADIESQPPYDSLPHIFRGFDRVMKGLRGNK